MGSFWEWAATSDSTAVLTAVLGTGGVGGVLMLLVRNWLREKPPREEQEKAAQAVAAPAPDRDALWIARQALEAATAASEKADRVTTINEHLWAWIRDIRGRWHIVRLAEDPPPPPIIDNNM